MCRLTRTHVRPIDLERRCMNQPLEHFNRGKLRVVGRRLRSVRVSKGWSLKKLSEASNTSIAAIRKIELGQTNPSLLTILAIVEALGEPIDRLVTSAQSLVGDIRLTRAADSMGDIEDDGAVNFGLSDGVQNPAMSGRLVSLARDTALKLDPNDDTAPVFGFVLEGVVIVEHAELGSIHCAAGDSFHMYRADVGNFRATPQSDARFILLRDHHHADAEANQ